VYFGVAHLLDYPAPYTRQLYRFADYNAGRYASRNAAFQNAVAQASGIPLDLDGDLLRYENGQPARDPGSTELATRVLARRIDSTTRNPARSVCGKRSRAFDQTQALSPRSSRWPTTASGKPVPRAIVPHISLRSPKITRQLTTEWFADRVDRRYQDCCARGRLILDTSPLRRIWVAIWLAALAFCQGPQRGGKRLAPFIPAASRSRQHASCPSKAWCVPGGCGAWWRIDGACRRSAARHSQR
jgi:hypothetical protein